MATENNNENNVNTIDPMLKAARLALRISSDAFDPEITDLISAARAELAEIGVLPSKTSSDTDPLIKRAVVLYVKAEFGLDNPDAPRYRESFDLLKRHLALASDYIEEPAEEES